MAKWNWLAKCAQSTAEMKALAKAFHLLGCFAKKRKRTYMWQDLGKILKLRGRARENQHYFSALRTFVRSINTWTTRGFSATSWKLLWSGVGKFSGETKECFFILAFWLSAATPPPPEHKVIHVVQTYVHICTTFAPPPTISP